MIKYTNISYENYYNLSDEERKAKPYFVEGQNFYPWFPPGRNYILGSISYDNGIKNWIVNGQNHREDGPAIIHSDGSKAWYLNGIIYTFEEWLEKLNKSDEEKVFLRLKYS